MHLGCPKFLPLENEKDLQLNIEQFMFFRKRWGFAVFFSESHSHCRNMSVLPAILIDNKIRVGSLRRDVVNPYTEEKIAEVSDCVSCVLGSIQQAGTGENSDVDAAVVAAEKAFHSWSRHDMAASRAKSLISFADEIDRNAAKVTNKKKEKKKKKGRKILIVSSDCFHSCHRCWKTQVRG